MCACGAA
jgi:hypothetical protein